MGKTFQQLFPIYQEKLSKKLKGDSSWNRVDPTVSMSNLEQMFKQTDPTDNNTYLEWIIKSYIDGGIKLIEDLGRTKTALVKYHKLGVQKKLIPEDKDINKFCGIVGCTQKFIEKQGLEDILEKYESIQTRGQAQRRIKLKEADLIYESDNLLVIHPLTESAAKYYGAGTRWCTAAENNNMFEKYNKRGPMYIIIPKHPSYPKEKYQVHEESDSYMDDKDERVLIYNLIEKYPELENIPDLKFMINEMMFNAIENESKTSDNIYKIVKKIIDKYPASVSHRENQTGITPLMFAIEEMSLIKDILINSGLSHPELQDKEGKTALMYASTKQDLSTIEMLLASREARPELQDKEGKTALMYALDENHEEIAGIILESDQASSDMVSMQDKDGNTALIYASKKGYTKIVDFILKIGQSKFDMVNMQDKYKNTALMYASEQGYDEIVEMLLTSRNVHPSMVSMQNIEGKTALMIASESGYSKEIVKMLLTLYPSMVNIQDERGRTALMYASMKGYGMEIVKILLDSQAHPNIQDNDGRTALMIAAVGNRYKIAETLLKGQANPDIRNKEGNTALDIALIMGNNETVKILKNYTV